MKLSLPIISESDPLPFHYRDLISINFRQFTMRLMENRIPDDSYQVVNVIFPWTDSARTFNQRDRHNVLPHAAKTMVTDVNELIKGSSCVIICAHISKLFCEIAIASPEPQTVHTLLEEMACPEGFATPLLHDAALTPSQFVAQYSDES